MAITRIIAARDPNGLTMDQVRAAAPAVFAERPSPKRSERYTFLSTIDQIKPLLDAGWIVTGATQRATRHDGRNPIYTRHQLQLAPDPKTVKKMVKLGDVRPELTMINSHDGQSTESLYAGLFRLACLNGLVVQSVDFGGFTRKHVGDAGSILEQANAAVAGLKEAARLVAEMETKSMTDAAMKKFAADAADAAYDRQDFDSTVLLASRRTEDEGRTVWQVYNRVQENVIRGGVRLAHTEGARRETVTRGISHVQRSVDLNLALWNLAAKQVTGRKAPALKKAA